MGIYDSIFGVEAPQFQFENEEIILLDYVKIIKDEAEKISILHESVITRAREWDDLGKHWTFELDLHLFKYEDPLTKYIELQTYKRRFVKLWRRRDGESIKNSLGETINFRFDKMNLLYMQTTDYKDIMRLSFISQDPIDIKQSILGTGESS